MTYKNSYTHQVYSFLKSHKSITRFQAAAKYGCFCLAQTICDLRRMGVEIDTSDPIYTDDGKHYVKYSLSKQNKVDPRGK